MTKNKKLPGDALVGFGGIVAILALALGFFTLNAGVGPAYPWLLVIAGLLLVIVGYLRRIVAKLP